MVFSSLKSLLKIYSIALISVFLSCLIYLFDGFVLFLSRVSGFFTPKSNNKSIAIVRVDRIGDFILWLDSAKEYKKNFPDKKVTLFANSLWANLASEVGYWDRVYPIDAMSMYNIFYRAKAIFMIGRERFDIVIQPTFSRSFVQGDSIVRACNAEQKIGSTGDLSSMFSFFRRISDSWYTKLITATDQIIFETHRNDEFYIGLFGELPVKTHPLIPIKKSMNHGINLPKNYFVIFPGASWSGKSWRSSNFLDVAVKIHEEYGWDVVLCGSKADLQICENISIGLHERGVNFLNIASMTSLSDLINIVDKAHFLLSNDTSAIHIAAAMGTPSVCIIGGGHFGRFMPYPENYLGTAPVAYCKILKCFGCSWKCTQKREYNSPVKCIEQLSVNGCLLKVKEALN